MFDSIHTPIFVCIHLHGFMCWRLYRFPLTIAPLSAAGENHSLKPAGVYEYRSGVVGNSRDRIW